MNPMGIDAKDSELFQLLKKLKDTNGTYPPALLSARRQGYLKQVAQIGSGAGLAVALKETVKHGKGVATSAPTAGTLLEGLLVVAIVIEAGAAAYFYRDKLTDIFHSITGSPRVEEVANPPVLSSPIANFEFTSSPIVTTTETITVTETATPFGTPTLLAEQPTNPSGSNGSTTVNGSGGDGVTQAVSTPNAAGGGTNENNGNKYGHTPIPERTKEPGNNTSNENTSQDNQTDPNKKK